MPHEAHPPPSHGGPSGHSTPQPPPPPPPPPGHTPPPPLSDNPILRALRIGRRFAVGGLALVGGAVILAAATAASAKQQQKKSIVEGTVLTMDLERGLVETQPRGPLQAFVPPAMRPLILREVLDALEHAERDPRVKGLVLRVGGPSVGFAVAQELVDAVRSFSRAPAKKFSVAFTETFGELQNGNEAYVLASACDEVHVQPSGDVTLGGLLSDAAFVKGALDRVGLAARIQAREEYKNAPNTFTETAFTPHHREATEHLLARLHAQMVAMVAEGRRLSADAAAAAFRDGPLSAAEALERSLIDSASYRDQVRERVKAMAAGNGVLPKDVKLVPVDRYYSAAVQPAAEDAAKEAAADAAAKAGKADAKEPSIALVYAVGNIMRGRSRDRSFGPDENCWSDVVVSALREAAEDESVRAVVMRVDSRGGSAVASDAIGREAMRVKGAGKPLVVTMGNYAASGGYWISMHATRIFAWPGTITGSIGVFGGKLLVRGLAEKLGVTFDWASAGGEGSAKFSSPLWDYDEHGSERLTAFLDRIYGDFVRNVAQGRNLPLERAFEVAKGRVWTGDDALKLGLVDESGGLRAAVRAAKVAAGLPADAPVAVREFGPGARRSFAESLQRFFKEPEDDIVSPAAEAGALSAAAAAAAEVVEMAGLARTVADLAGLRPLLDQAAELRGLEGGAVARAAPPAGALDPRARR